MDGTVSKDSQQTAPTEALTMPGRRHLELAKPRFAMAPVELRPAVAVQHLLRSADDHHHVAHHLVAWTSQELLRLLASRGPLHVPTVLDPRSHHFVRWHPASRHSCMTQQPEQPEQPALAEIEAGDRTF